MVSMETNDVISIAYYVAVSTGCPEKRSQDGFKWFFPCTISLDSLIFVKVLLGKQSAHSVTRHYLTHSLPRTC